jgi:hypothetical protein
MARKRNGASAATAAAPPVDNPQGDSAATSNGEEKRQPFHRIRMRNVSAAIWQNRSERGPWYSVTFSRSYRDAQNNWHTSESFGGPDLPILAEVARAAFLWIVNATQSPNTAVQAGARDAQPVVDSEIPF